MLERIERIKQRIASDSIDGLFITSPYNISYLTNLFPSTIEEREYYLFVTKNNAYIICPKMFLLAIKEKLDGFLYVEITAENSLYKILEQICEKENIRSFGFEEENLLFKEFNHLNKRLKKINFVPLIDFIEDDRAIKDEDEIRKTSKACSITDDCFSQIVKKLKTGVTEKEIASEIEFYLNKYGGNAFSPIVAFGKNSAVPHHIPTSYKLEVNSFVLLDFGAKFEGYCSDMSRTIYYGDPSENDVRIYTTVLEAQVMALEKLKEWREKEFQLSHLHSIAKSHIEKNGFESFPHSLGHGMGLQVHELPTISIFSEGNELKENMIIAIEPAIYITDACGVRIEDSVLLKNNGYELLTKSPKELTIVK